jgi:hypothetical protein
MYRGVYGWAAENGVLSTAPQTRGPRRFKLVLMRCLPHMAPTASHEYLRCLLRVPVLPLTSTCCLPRPPQLRCQLKEVPELVSLEAHGKSAGVIFGVSNGCETRQR